MLMQLLEWKSKFAVQTRQTPQALEVRGLREDMDIVMTEGNDLIIKQHAFAARQTQVSPLATS